MIPCATILAGKQERIEVYQLISNGNLMSAFCRIDAPDYELILENISKKFVQRIIEENLEGIYLEIAIANGIMMDNNCKIHKLDEIDPIPLKNMLREELKKRDSSKFIPYKFGAN